MLQRTSLTFPNSPAGLWLCALKPHCMPKKKKKKFGRAAFQIPLENTGSGMAAWGRLLDKSSASSFRNSTIFWHCRLRSLKKLVCRTLLPFLQQALHSFFLHALPPPRCSQFQAFPRSHSNPPCVVQPHCGSSLLQLVLHRQQVMPKPLSDTEPALASARIRNDLATLPTHDRNIFLFRHSPLKLRAISPRKK